MKRADLFRAALAAALAALAGCATPYRDALARGEEARASGDVVEAAVQYRKACQADPGYVDTCKEADALRRQVMGSVAEAAQAPCGAGKIAECKAALAPGMRVDAADPALKKLAQACAKPHFEAARAPCGKGDVLACRDALAIPRELLPRERALDELLAGAVSMRLDQASVPCRAGKLAECNELLAPVLAVRPGDADARALQEDAERARAEKCAAVSSSGALKDVLDSLTCLEGGAGASEIWKDAMRDHRRKAARALEELGRTPAYAQPGAAWALAAAVACLDRDAYSVETRDTAWRALQEAAVLKVAVDSAAPALPAAQVCEAALAHLGDAVRCAEPAAASLVVGLRAEEPKVSSTVEEENRPVQYRRSGGAVANPARDKAQKALDQAEAELKAAQRASASADAECAQAQSALARAGKCFSCPPRARADAACRDAEARSADYDRRLAARDAAKKALAAVPATVESTQSAEAVMVVRRHRFTARMAVSTAPDPAKGGAWKKAEWEALREDEESAGVAEASLPPDPLETPDAAFWSGKQLAFAARAVADTVRARLAAGPCAGPALSGPWLHCHVERQLWTDAVPPETDAVDWMAAAAATPGAARPRLSCE